MHIWKVENTIASWPKSLRSKYFQVELCIKTRQHKAAEHNKIIDRFT